MNIYKGKRFMHSGFALFALMALAACSVPAPVTQPTSATAATAVVTPTIAHTPTASPAETETPPTTSTTALTGTTVPTSTPATTPEATSGDGIDGQWEGAIQVAGQEIGMVVKFMTADGVLQGRLDIPAQAAMDLPLSNVKYEPPQVYFEAFGAAQLATFDGKLQDDTIAGEFKQSTFTGTFTLQRTQVAATPPPPYGVEEVTFKNGAAALAGSLTLPEGDGPHPAVVLISGSGAQNRDENIFGFKVFGTIADHLTRNGIAVLRYDDRGIGGSTGDMTNATSEDFAEDVMAAVDLLKTRPDIDAKRIGLIGHSEGGLIAPMVATRSNDVAFVVLLAGPGMPGADVLREQLTLILKANGATQAEIDQALAEQQRMIDVMLTGNGMDEYLADWRTRARATVEALPEEQRKQYGDIDESIEQAVQGQRQLLESPWFKFFLTYDPVPALQQLRVPVLAIFGAKDLQVAAESNARGIEAALKAGGNTDYVIHTFPEANHLFQAANSGSPNEYATLPKEFAPGFLDFLTDWLKSKTQP